MTISVVFFAKQHASTFRALQFFFSLLVDFHLALVSTVPFHRNKFFALTPVKRRWPEWEKEWKTDSFWMRIRFYVCWASKPNLVDRSWQFLLLLISMKWKTGDYTYEFELSCRCDSFDWMAFLHVHTNQTCANLFLYSSFASQNFWRWKMHENTWETVFVIQSLMHYLGREILCFE